MRRLTQVSAKDAFGTFAEPIDLASLGRRLCSLGLLIALVASGYACSSSSSGGDTANVTVDQACADGINALCDRIFACYGLVADYAYGDAATCKKRAAIGCTQSVTLAGTSTTPQKIEACAQAISGISCADLIAGLNTGILSSAPACTPDPGKADNGKACGDDAQCVSTFCAKKSSDDCGTCAPLPKAGDACVNNTCGRGLTCANNKCVKPAPLGATCDDNNPCTQNTYCYSGKCTAGGKAGDTCDLKGKTAVSGCDGTAGLGCKIDLTKATADSLPGQCQKITEAKTGEACSYVDLKVCVAGAYCQGTDPTKPGTCIAAAADGAACDDAKGPGCLAPANCVKGICKLPDPTSCK